MRAKGSGGGSSARLLLGGGVAPVAALPAAPSPPSYDKAQHALCAATAVLFLASMLYVLLSILSACSRATERGRQQLRPVEAEPRPPPPPAHQQPAAEIKRALEEIPVVVVHARGRGGSDGCARIGAQEEDAAGKECAVCLAEFAGGEEVRVLPACRHAFHRECVDRWLLMRAPTCPVCRATVASRSDRLHAKRCARPHVHAVLPPVGH